MTTPITGTCSKQVFHAKEWGTYSCALQATTIVDGKRYCSIHTPAYVKAKRAQREARWDANSAARTQARLDKEEQDRRAACYPDLLAALKAAHSHLQELRDAWERGAISEHDGKGGTRSDRNVDCEVQARAAIARSKGETP